MPVNRYCAILASWVDVGGTATLTRREQISTDLTVLDAKPLDTEHTRRATRPEWLVGARNFGRTSLKHMGRGALVVERLTRGFLQLIMWEDGALSIVVQHGKHGLAAMHYGWKLDAKVSQPHFNSCVGIVTVVRTTMVYAT